MQAAVNWVHVSDIARVSFEAIFDSKHDGATLEVTGEAQTEKHSPFFAASVQEIDWLDLRRGFSKIDA
jgi:hypothetical protein